MDPSFAEQGSTTRRGRSFDSTVAGEMARKANASVRAKHAKVGRRALMREIAAQHAATPEMTVAELLMAFAQEVLRDE